MGPSTALPAILTSGVDVNVADYDGRTALHLAAAEGRTEAVDALLEAGANKSAVDRFGSTPLEDAQRYWHNDVVALLQGGTVSSPLLAGRGAAGTTPSERERDGCEHDSGASNRELLHAAKEGDLADIKRLKLKGANLTGADYDGRTALHIAAKHGHIDCLRYLVASVPGVNVNVQDRFHETPYSEAMASGNVEAAEYLKSLGAAEVDTTGTGAEMCRLAFAGDLEGLKRAYHAGKSLNAADYDGRTACRLAVAGGHTDVLEFLANPGSKGQAANLNATDRYGGTPLEDAQRCGKTGAVRTLLALGAMDIVHSRRGDGDPSLRGTSSAAQAAPAPPPQQRLVRRKNAARPASDATALTIHVPQGGGGVKAGYEGDDDLPLVTINPD